jgi:hypothetical protein
MGTWLRIGRRFEWTMAAAAVLCFLGFGFFLTTRAPADIRWMVWIFVAGFVFPFALFMTLTGRLMLRASRRKESPPRERQKPLGIKTRVVIYAVFLIATMISTMGEANRVLLGHFFSISGWGVVFWNLVAVSFLITICELIEWRRRRLFDSQQRR